MQLDIITCLPQLLESPYSHSIITQAIEHKKATICIHNLRDYTSNKHRKVDDYVYGGGGGMLLIPAPLAKCIKACSHPIVPDEVIYMAPDGELLTQALANRLSLCHKLVIVCGHYKGIDERIRDKYITREVSIGNYVLSGGELAAAVLVDTIIRLLPGVLSNEMSALTDSFQDQLLAPPAYTRPQTFEDMEVPDVLLSGNEGAIQAWRYQKALERTHSRRPIAYQGHEQQEYLRG